MHTHIILKACAINKALKAQLWKNRTSSKNKQVKIKMKQFISWISVRRQKPY